MLKGYWTLKYGWRHVGTMINRAVRWPFEALGAVIGIAVVRTLPLDWASAFGGWLFRMVGPWLNAHKVARDNLRRAFPDLDDAGQKAVLRGMWDNLGRVAAEYMHIDRIMDPASGRVSITGMEHVEALRDDGKPGLTYSAHLANWEIISQTATRAGLPMHRFYRAPNNPLLQNLFKGGRDGASGELLPKGRDGAKRAYDLMRKGEHLGLLIDQKMNDGLPIPFFGHDAMTAPAVATLAYRFKAPLVPARVIRLKGCHFQVEVLPPADLPQTGDMHADVRATLVAINQQIEAWVREHPDQWLWVHRRWPD